MKRTVTAAAIAAALLLLAGCGAGTQENVAVNSTGPASETAAPLTAETPATATAEAGDAAFLEEVRAELRPNNVIPNATDEQLLEAGQKACEGIAAGADTLTLSLIDGEKMDAAGIYPDSATIIIAARSSLCAS